MFSKRTNAPGSSSPSPQPSPASLVPTVISVGAVITGNLSSQGEVHLDGTVHGNVRVHTLVIGETAVIEGEISADTVRISGSIQGPTRAREVLVSRTARVRGDILHQLLSVEAGAAIDGHCKVVDDAGFSEASGAMAAPRRITSEPIVDARTTIDVA